MIKPMMSLFPMENSIILLHIFSVNQLLFDFIAYESTNTLMVAAFLKARID